MRTATFERDGHRYEVLIASIRLGQECYCGACDWRPTEPLNVIRATPARFPEFRDPHGEGHMDVEIEIVCGGCGEHAHREVLTSRVDLVSYSFLG